MQGRRADMNQQIQELRNIIALQGAALTLHCRDSLCRTESVGALGCRNACTG